jgi:hypothetical protein
MPKGLLLLLIVSGFISAQPLDSQELPFAGSGHAQTFLRTIYRGLERFTSLWHPSGIPFLAEGGGDGGGSDGGGSDGGGDDGSDGGVVTEGVVTAAEATPGVGTVQAMLHRVMTQQPQPPEAWRMMRKHRPPPTQIRVRCQIRPPIPPM